MKLSYPCVITPRLMAGVQIGRESWVSISYAGGRDADGRVRYRYCIDGPDGLSYEGDDVRSGCQVGTLRDGLSSLLAFLGACGESVAYTRRTGREGDNADLFPPAVAEWCDTFSDELSMAQIEVDESEECIDE